MNELISSLILAIIQGFTEWLPISSSGHLVLFEKILDYQNNLVFDVALHFGTLMSVLIYFNKDIIKITKDILSKNWESKDGKLGVMIVIATIPAALVGFFFKKIFEQTFSQIEIVAFGFAVSGMFLVITSICKKRKENFGYRGAIVVGIAQVFALFPGISRSGSTIGAGILSGLDEKQAIKFSFLMSIPIILGTNILVIEKQIISSDLIFPVIISFIVGLGTIHLLYGKIVASKKNLKWFGIYAIALSIAIAIYSTIN